MCVILTFARFIEEAFYHAVYKLRVIMKFSLPSAAIAFFVGGYIDRITSRADFYRFRALFLRHILFFGKSR